MPNRIIKESICTSDNVNDLSAEAERFFTRLMVQCDDYGRMDARIPVLRARCFPLKLETVNEDHIRAWLAELVSAGLISIYTADDGRPYLYFLTWEKHQQVRAKRSKYPAPDANAGKSNGMIADDSNGNQLQTYVPENPIQSNTNTNTNPTPEVENIFVIFERDIGIITPTVAERIGEAEREYSSVMVVEAIKAAALANKRSWNYVEGILRNWKAEGRSSPKTKRGEKPKQYEEIWIDGELKLQEVKT